MMKAKWIPLLGLAFLLTLPSLGMASELCSEGAVASAENDAFFAKLQAPPVSGENQPELTGLEGGEIAPIAAACTPEVCDAAAESCAQSCYPCEPVVQCAPYCWRCRCIC